MPRKRIKKSSTDGATVGDLHRLQALVAQALEQEISDGIASGKVDQAAIRNALSMLRDCDIVAAADTEEQLSNIVVTDLLNSRESVSLPMVLQLQAILGVEEVSKDRYMEAAESYFEFITSKVEASNS